MARVRVHVLVLSDCTAFVPIGLADMLRKSAALASSLPGAKSRNQLEIALVSATKDRNVTCAGGVRLRCDAALRDVKRSDLVLVPALEPDIVAHLAQNRDVVPWLR